MFLLALTLAPSTNLVHREPLWKWICDERVLFHYESIFRFEEREEDYYSIRERAYIRFRKRKACGLPKARKKKVRFSFEQIFDRTVLLLEIIKKVRIDQVLKSLRYARLKYVLRLALRRGENVWNYPNWIVFEISLFYDNYLDPLITVEAIIINDLY